MRRLERRLLRAKAGRLVHRRTDWIDGIKAPRTLVSSRDRQLIGIGLRDGSVVFCRSDQRRELARSKAPDHWTGGVRSLSEIAVRGSRRWWLAGYANGELKWISVEVALPAAAGGAGSATWAAAYPEAELHTDLVHVGALAGSGTYALVSWAALATQEEAIEAHAPTQVVRVVDRGHDQPPELVFVRGLPEIERVRAIFDVNGRGGHAWLLLTYTADLWLLTHDEKDGSFHPQNLKIVVSGAGSGIRSWDGALVMDAARPRATGNELLVTTNSGMFWLTLDPIEPLVRGMPIWAQGTRGLSMAVTGFEDEGCAFAWSSDALGNAQLSLITPEARNPSPWRCLDMQRGASPAIQAVAVPRAGKVFVWQTRIDQSVAVTEYAVGSSGPLTNPAELNELRTLEAAEQWMREHYEQPTLGALPARQRSGGPAAVLADLFEPPRGGAHHLWLFLADPQPELAHAALAAMLESASEEEIGKIVGNALALWTQTLVGSIHRLTTDQRQTGRIEDHALGIIHWLNRLSRLSELFVALPAAKREKATKELKRAARGELFSVRRWTFYSPSLQTPALAMFSPSESQDEPTTPGNLRGYLEERLASSAVIFSQRAIDDLRIHPLEVQGPIFDIAILQECEPRAPSAATTDLVAFLWRQSCIHVFRLAARGTAGSRLEKQATLNLRADPDDDRQLSLTIPGERFGRALSLFYNDGRCWAVTSVVRSGRQYLVTVDLGPQGARALAPTLASEPLALDDFLSAAAGKPDQNPVAELWSSRVIGAHLALGLRTAQGACVSLVPTGSFGHGRGMPSAPSSTAKLRSIYGRDDTNAVLTLSHVVGDHTGQPRMIAGCGDGRVWYLERKHATSTLDAYEVDALSAPIWSVAGAQQGPNGALRVYAGAADGQIAAYQRLPEMRAPEAAHRARGRETDGAMRKEEAEPAFASLWATREGDAIVRIESVDAALTAQTDLRSPVVVAVSRDGRAVAFADEETVNPGSYDDASSARRPRVPGQRIERFKLRSPAFGARLLSSTAAHEGLGKLVVVSADNFVRIVDLLQPKRSLVRRNRHGALLDLWQRSIRDDRQLGRPLDPYRLRYAEALRGLAPQLYLLTISALWNEDGPSQSSRRGSELAAERPALSLGEVETSWFPRYLRPHVSMVRAFRWWTRKLLHQSPEVSTDDRDRMHKDLKLGLRHALESAFELRDKALFQEITANVLKHFNLLIKRVVRYNASASETLAGLYLDALEEIDGACRLWLSTDATSHGHVQIVKIKNLVDGDVIFQLTRAISRFSHAQNPASAERAPRARRAQAIAATLRKITDAHIAQVGRLMLEGKPLVRLETIRATNLALIRAAWIQWRENDRIVWSDLGKFLDVLGRFATVAAPSADDALCHEIARCYALCVVLSPQHAAASAFGISAARLPAKVVRAVEEQVRLVHRLVERHASREGASFDEAIDEASAVLKRVMRGKLEDEEVSSYGEGFQARTGEFLPDEQGPSARLAYYRKAHFEHTMRVVTWLEQLAQSLEHSPEDVSFEPVEAFLENLRAGSEDGSQRFDSDRRFWFAALAKLKQVCERYGLVTQGSGAGEMGGTVRPALVLSSSALTKWASVCRQEIDALYGQHVVQDPLYSRYRSVLEQLRVTASRLTESMAVHRALVTGVLDHHLLELLDDHVLQLREIAHVVHPCLTDALGPARGAPERFSSMLVKQMRVASTIPKNLRTLYHVVDRIHNRSQPTMLQALLESALRLQRIETIRVEGGGDAETVEAKCADRLRLVCHELARNYVVHGDRTIAPRIVVSESGVTLVTGLQTEPHIREDQSKRLKRLSDENLQQFLEPSRKAPDSTGLGLYLANLAAATVSFRLRVIYPYEGKAGMVGFAIEAVRS